MWSTMQLPIVRGENAAMCHWRWRNRPCANGLSDDTLPLALVGIEINRGAEHLRPWKRAPVAIVSDRRRWWQYTIRCVLGVVETVTHAGGGVVHRIRHAVGPVFTSAQKHTRALGGTPS